MWTFHTEAQIISQKRIRDTSLNYENLQGQNIFIEKNIIKDEPLIFFQITETTDCLDDYDGRRVPTELLDFFKKLKYQDVNVESLSEVFEIEVDLPYQLYAIWFNIKNNKLHTKRFQVGSFETFIKKDSKFQRLKLIHSYIKPVSYGENEEHFAGIFNDIDQRNFLKIINLMSERELYSRHNFYYGGCETGIQCCSLKEATPNFYMEEVFNLENIQSLNLIVINNSGKMNLSIPEIEYYTRNFNSLTSVIMMNKNNHIDQSQKILDIYSSLHDLDWGYTTNVKHIIYKLLDIVNEIPSNQRKELSLTSSDFYSQTLIKLIENSTGVDFCTLQTFLRYFIFQSNEDFGISQINFRIKNK